MLRSSILRRSPSLSLGLIALSGSLLAQEKGVYEWSGQPAGGRFGEDVVTLDVDGDTWRDIAVASPGATSGRGEVRVLCGSTGVELYRLSGNEPGARFGQSIARVGDLDGDQRDEILVASPLANASSSGSGAVDLFSGATGAFLYRIDGTSPQGHFGWSLCAIEDRDGDGYDEWAAGAVDESPNGLSSGRVYWFSGKTGQLLGSFDGPQARGLFGWSLTQLDDWDGDTMSELAVGAPGTATSGLAGSAYVISLPLMQIVDDWSGQAVGDRFGESVGNAGQIAADTRDELIVGASQGTNAGPGYAQVFRAGSNPAVLGWKGTTARDAFGFSVVGLGDVDGDLVDDVAVAAPRQDAIIVDGGSVHFFSGKNGSVLGTVHGEQLRMELGAAMCPAGDLNLDGVSDVVAGAPADSSSANQAGAARALSALPLAFSASAHELSISNPQTTKLSIDMPPSFAGRTYQVLGSVHGVLPGTQMGGLNLYLNRDRYFRVTLALTDGVMLTPGMGKLDANGDASVAFDVLPHLLDPSYAGLTFHHAFIIWGAGNAVTHASHPVPVTMTL